MDIAALLRPFHSRELSSLQLQQISAYLDRLLRWNARMNLTAVREAGNIVTRHFGESLFAAAQLFPAGELPVPDGRLLDVGSGAGFPGLPMKIWAPGLDVILIESRQRKAAFLREVVRDLALDNVAVFSGRAQDFPGRAQVVTLRAVERFEDVLLVAARLCGTAALGCGANPGCALAAPSRVGHSKPETRNSKLALLIGSAQIAVARRLLPHFAWADPLPIPLSSSRVLLIGTHPSSQDSTQ